MAPTARSMNTDVLRQHLIDPEICIRCNTCEETCPIDAITHDSRNYVVDPSICNACNACIAPCPTGAIDNWRQVPRADAYSTEAQLGWDTLPPQEAIAADDSVDVPAEIWARRTSDRRWNDEIEAFVRARLPAEAEHRAASEQYGIIQFRNIDPADCYCEEHRRYKPCDRCTP